MGLIGFFVLLVIFFSIPGVQTFIAKKVTNSLNEKYGTSISVDQVRIKYNGYVDLKQVYIADHHKDTLIYAQNLETSLLSIRQLINGTMNLGDVAIDHGRFYIKKYKGEDNDNLYIFSRKFNSGNQPPGEPFKLTASNILLTHSHFKFQDENLENPDAADFKNLTLDADDFDLNGDIVSARMNDLQFDAKRGYKLRGLVADFHYDPDEIALNNMILKSVNSQFTGSISLDSSNDAFSDFNNKVVFNLDLIESTISTSDLQAFYEEFGADKTVHLKTHMQGSLNNFALADLDLEGLGNSKITGDFNFVDLLSEDHNFTITGDFSQLQTNFFDLTGFLPNILGNSLPKEFVRLGVVNLKGNTIITQNSVYVKSNINSALGYAETDIELQNTQDIDNATYVGDIRVNKFLIGRLLGVNKLGATSFNLNVSGEGFTPETLNTRVRGRISRANYNGYTYQNITVSGNLQNPLFDGQLQIDDPNARLNFNGLIDVTAAINNYDFTADIDYVDFSKLNFLKDSLAVLKGRVVMDMQGTNIDDAAGSIQFSNASFQNENDLYTFDDFRITSFFNDNIRTIDINSPDIISGEVSGNFKIENVVPLFKNAIGSLYANYEPETITSNQFMDFDLQINSKIVEVFVPEIKIEPNTYIRGSVVSDDSDFKLTFRSPKIQAFGFLAEAINVRVDNKNPLFNTYIEADSIGSGLYGISDFSLINVTLKDTLFMRSEFKGGKKEEDRFDLSFYHTINENNNSVVGFRKSGIKFKDNQWYLNVDDNNKNRVVFDNNFQDVDIEELILSHDQERISLMGQLKDSTYKDLKANFNSVRLSHITPYIDSLKLSGVVNGGLNLLQQDGAYYPDSKITIDQFSVNETLLGNLNLSIEGNETLTSYDIDTKLVNDGFESLSAKGDINVSNNNPAINMDVQLRKLDLSAFSPLGGEVISNIRGLASGRATVTGDYKNPDINGELLLRQAGMKIPYLNTDYDFQGTARVTLNKQQFRFNDVQLRDVKYKTEGQLTGTISHEAFSNWELDLGVTTDRLLVLDTQEDEFSLYYGTAFISGDATIAGPSDELVIDVTATTEKGTTFKIPLSDTESFGDSSAIYFLSPEEKQARLGGEEIIVKDIKGLELNFDLEVTRDAEVEIVVDEVNGSTLRGRGAGYLLIQINTNGKFNMFGDFTPYEGTYNFKYSGVVQKQFDIMPEGKISWDGSPEKALLDISAVYRTQANPSILLENPSINRKIPVNVIINLDGELLQPDITFDFDFPNTSSIVTSELAYRLDDRSIRELQAFSLVTQGSFYSQTALDGQAVVAGNLIETASGIFNDILSDDDSKFTVGLDYVQGDRRPDLQTSGRFGFTLSTQISNRVIINGKVGVPVGGVSESAVVGDVEVNFLLNEEGTLRATIFNRQNDIQFIGGDYEGYTQGTGLTYSVDFNTFKDLIHQIFKGKAREVEEEIKIIPPDSEIPYNGVPEYK